MKPHGYKRPGDSLLLRAEASRGLTSPTCGAHAATLHQPGSAAFQTFVGLKKRNQSKVFKSVSCQVWEAIMNGAGVELKSAFGTETHPAFCFFPHVQRSVFDDISI